MNNNGPQHLLFEHISGYELFELKAFESIANESYMEYLALTQVVTHISRLQFANSGDVVRQIRADACEGAQISPELANFFALNHVTILFADRHYRQLLAPLGIEYRSAPEIMRGIRANIHKFIARRLDAQLLRSVAHILAREMIRYDMEREDNVVVAVGFECEELEAEIDSLSARMSNLIDWAVPHFKKQVRGEKYNEELARAIGTELSRLAMPNSSEESATLLDEVAAIRNISADDLNYLQALNYTIMSKRKLLSDLKSYLSSKLHTLAPNLSAILGNQLSFRFIHKAGGLTNLVLMPASTLQLLGAEKALFRSLKMRTRTPKYGLLCGMERIKNNRGRLCRFIASKCSLAARIDAFSKEPVDAYGKELRRLIDKKIALGRSGRQVEHTEDLLTRVHTLVMNTGSKMPARGSITDAKPKEADPRAHRREEPNMPHNSHGRSEAREEPQASGCGISSQKPFTVAGKKDLSNTARRGKSPYDMTESAKHKMVSRNEVRKRSRRNGKS